MTETAPLPEPDFPTTWWGRQGYRCEDVDAFVEQVRRALRSDPPAMAPYEVGDQQFGGVRFTRGYAMRSVDEYLDRARSTLRERHGEDAVAALDGQPPHVRHFPTVWIYLVAAVLVLAMLVFALTQL